MLKLNRKRGIIIAAALALVLIIAYVAYSYVTWQSYASDYRRWEKDSTAKMATAFNRPIGEETTKTEKLETLEKSAQSVSSGSKSVCDVPVLVRWQTTVESIDTRRSDCFSARDSVKSEAADIIELISYIKLEQQLVEIIAEAEKASADSSNPDSWAQIQQSWQQAVENTRKLADDDNFNSTRDLVAEQLTQLASAWQSLVAAHEAQDETQFVAAQSGIQQAYANLANSASSLSDSNPLNL